MNMIVLLIALSVQMLTFAYPAVVVSPIADLLFQPMSELKNNYKKGYSYAQIPISGSPRACPRAHQARANELVDVLEERNDEVRVRIYGCFYVRNDTTAPQQSYWMRKQDIIPCDELCCCTPEETRVPSPICVDKPIPSAVTLAQPWYDSKTKTLFSAGTRFASLETTPTNAHVFVFDPSKKQYISSLCPLSYCVISSPIPSEQRVAMVSLARSWTQNEYGFIPYAWGGCSIGKRIAYSHAHEHTIQLANGSTATYHQWPGRHHAPKSGIDCSGLILLAAQSVGIPYFCKNSRTVEQIQKPITQQDPLEIGDIIMFKGHVMIVADLERNTLIEARGYINGYGKVHEIPLSEQFKNINTYQDLIACYEQQILVERLDKKGNPCDPVQIKLFKLF